MNHVALQDAYAHCIALARRHYENFPVASWFLPRALREPIAVIYAFARTADDIADEGNAAPNERLAELERYRERLSRLGDAYNADQSIFIALADVIARHHLPVQLFHDLLTAFAMDVTKKHYADFAEVEFYCRHSANPIGRLLLHLYGAATPQNLEHADAVCTALQLINFYQDLAQDIDENQRIYVPQDEMQRFGVRVDEFVHHRTTPAMLALMDFQIQRARVMLQRGTPLGNALHGRIGFELRLVIAGGLRILDALEQRGDDAFARPRLTKSDGIAMMWHALTANNTP